jgi:hypothetical protein
MAVPSDETARLAEIAARRLAGKSVSELTAGAPPSAAAKLIEGLADLGRIFEEVDALKSSASASS